MTFESPWASQVEERLSQGTGLVHSCICQLLPAPQHLRRGTGRSSRASPRWVYSLQCSLLFACLFSEGGQRTTFRSWFFPSPVGFEDHIKESSSTVTSSLICCSTLLPPHLFLILGKGHKIASIHREKARRHSRAECRKSPTSDGKEGGDQWLV